MYMYNTRVGLSVGLSEPSLTHARRGSRSGEPRIHHPSYIRSFFLRPTDAHAFSGSGPPPRAWPPVSSWTGGTHDTLVRSQVANLQAKRRGTTSQGSVGWRAPSQLAPVVRKQGGLGMNPTPTRLIDRKGSIGVSDATSCTCTGGVPCVSP